MTSVAGPQVAALGHDDGKGPAHVGRATARADHRHASRSTSRRSARPLRSAQWRLPKLTALDVAGQAAVVGLLLESRLETVRLAADESDFDRRRRARAIACPPLRWRIGAGGAPLIAPVAAFYAPHARLRSEGPLRAAAGRIARHDQCAADAHRIEARSPRRLRADERDRQIARVRFFGPGRLASDRSHARRRNRCCRRKPIPPPTAAREFTCGCRKRRRSAGSRNVYFRAVSTPDGWLDEWNDEASRISRVSSGRRDARRRRHRRPIARRHARPGPTR